jgi:hypothetical protein
MALRSEIDILGMADGALWFGCLARTPGAVRLEDLMVRSDTQRRVSNHGPGHQSGDASSRLKRKAPARLPGGRNSNCGFSPSTLGDDRQKKRVSRLMIARTQKFHPTGSPHAPS